MVFYETSLLSNFLVEDCKRRCDPLERSAHAVKSLQLLHALDLVNDPHTSTDAYKPKEIISASQNETKALLTGCHRGHFERVDVARALLGNTSLQCLVLYDDSIEENHADTIMALLEENKTLSLVDYRSTYSTSITIGNVSKLLRSNTSLQLLAVTGNAGPKHDETDRDIHQLTTLIKETNTLQSLYVGWCNFKGDESHCIVSMVNENTTLKQLELGECLFNDQDFDDFVHGLSENKNILSLIIFDVFSGISLEQMEKLIAGLVGNSTLIELQIETSHEYNVGVRYVEILLELIKINTSLVRIDILGSFAPEAVNVFLARLEEALSHNSTLLDFSFQDIHSNTVINKPKLSKEDLCPVEVCKETLESFINE